MNCIQAEASQAQLLHLTAAYKYSTPNPWSSPSANRTSDLNWQAVLENAVFLSQLTYIVKYTIQQLFSVLNKVAKKPKEIRKTFVSFWDKTKMLNSGFLWDFW